MNKLFTLISAIVVALSAAATDYTAPLVVKVADGLVPIESAVISLDPVEDTNQCDLVLHNFVFGVGERSVAIGNISATVTTRVSGGKVVIDESTTATVTAGDDPNVSAWVGPMLYPKLPVTIKASATPTDLEATITMTLGGVGEVVAYFGKTTSEDADAPQAFEYAEPISVEMSGVKMPQGDAAFTLTIVNEEKANFKLKNFIFTYPDGSGSLPFGNVEVNDLDYVVDLETNTINIKADNVTANIVNGDAGIVPMWMGPLMFPTLPVTLDIEAKINNVKGIVALNVPMVGDLTVYVGEDPTTGIRSVSLSDEVVAVYDIAGVKVATMEPGHLYIVKMADGQCKKVIK